MISHCFLKINKILVLLVSSIAYKIVLSPVYYMFVLARFYLLPVVPYLIVLKRVKSSKFLHSACLIVYSKRLLSLVYGSFVSRHAPNSNGQPMLDPLGCLSNMHAFDGQITWPRPGKG